MEQPLLQQSEQFLLSLALGAALGVWYDLLRGLRRNVRFLTHAADAVFCLTVLFGALCTALFVGGGQYRLFMAIGTASGAALYFLTLGRVFLPLFDGFWRILTAPARLACRFFKKSAKKLRFFSKNLFSNRKLSDKIKRQEPKLRKE